MNRRRFLQTGLLGSVGLSAVPGLSLASSCAETRPGNDLPAQLRTQYHSLLFDEYLPYWEQGAFDEELGGFMCYLHDDGSVQDDRKDIWYQGRGIWVYAYLYNNLDRDQKWLDMAQKSRDFMVAHMHRGDGTWIDTVNRRGRPVSGIDASRDGNIYGALFATVGLIELAKATGSDQDMPLITRTLRRSLERYEDVGYLGVTTPVTDQTGLRAQGHSFMLAWVLPQLLDLGENTEFEPLLRAHVDHIGSDFWNPEYGISNEIVFHDYSRIPELADRMVPGHSIETQWMAMEAARRLGDAELATIFRDRMRRLIEMSWDYVFDGIGDTDFRVFADESGGAGADFSIKTMWAQTEVLVGTMLVWGDTGDEWARDWHIRSRDYLLRVMATDYGVWRQAVDRRGVHKERDGISPYRKGNFHQPRALMMCLVELDRMLQNATK